MQKEIAVLMHLRGVGQETNTQIDTGIRGMGLHALLLPVCLYWRGTYMRGKAVFVCEALAKLHL